MRLFIFLFAILIATNCFAQSFPSVSTEFFSEREELISIKPIVASKNLSESQNNFERQTFRNKDKDKDSFEQNLENKKNIIGNPLGLRPKPKTASNIVDEKIDIKTAKKDTPKKNTAKKDIEKKISKLSNLGQAIKKAKNLSQDLAQVLPSSDEMKKIIRSKGNTKQEQSIRGYKF